MKLRLRLHDNDHPDIRRQRQPGVLRGSRHDASLDLTQLNSKHNASLGRLPFSHVCYLIVVKDGSVGQYVAFLPENDSRANAPSRNRERDPFCWYFLFWETAKAGILPTDLRPGPRFWFCNL